MKHMWYIYALEYYSDIKKNELMPFPATRMDREIIILSEVSQREKDKYHINNRCNLYIHTIQLIYKRETDSQTKKTNLWLSKRKDGGR